MKPLLLAISCLLSAAVVSAQLTPQQRAFDFQNLAALYAKRYAPLDWKKRAFGFDAMDIGPWLARVSNAKDDLEFFEIEAEYIASLNDTHSSFSMSSSFVANLGITVDIYDGKVLIDSINRALLPAVRFPFAIGDELVSVDGKTVEELITELSRFVSMGNPDTKRRSAASRITVRGQNGYPRAVELGGEAQVEIRRASGQLATFALPWTKTGMPIRTVGPVPMPKSSVSRAAQSEEELLRELQNWKLRDSHPLLEAVGWGEDPDGQPRKFVLGVGARTPIIRPGMPSSFVQRLGQVASDFNYSGTYRSGNRTIGYLRIPSFSPPVLGNAVRELDTELDYFEKNTDGLVVDVMRNPGGGCYMLDAAARLIPHPFYFFGESIRVTQDRVNNQKAILDTARARNAPTWVIQTYEFNLVLLQEALAANRGMTEPIAACTQFGSDWAPLMEGNSTAAVVYTKPIVILIDAYSISAADIFPAMMQDNGRGTLVGMRTSGGGGSVSNWPSGFYSETFASNTNTLVVRKNPIVTSDLPTAPYVENIGARPDVLLDYMTRENLLNGGRSFVEAFTAILVDRIEKGQ